MTLRFTELMRALIAGGVSAPWAGITLALEITAPTGAAITSTTSGLAPFGVTFNMFNSTATVGKVRDYLFYYDFGDGSAPVYDHGEMAGLSSNYYAGGPVMGHVYENPSPPLTPYAPRIWASDGVHTVGPLTASVTVTDPDSVFSAANTWYIHPTVAPTPGVTPGVPVGANVAAIADYTSIVSNNLYTFTGKRVRLCKGAEFVASGSGAKNGLKNIYLDTYGTGGTYATIKSTGSGANASLYPFPNNYGNACDVARVVGIHFTRDDSADALFTGTVNGTTRVLTVTTAPTNPIQAGARLHYFPMNSVNSVIQTFGSIDPGTGLASTGTGGTGTYLLGASSTCLDGLSQGMATTTTQSTGLGVSSPPVTTGNRDFELGRWTIYRCKFSKLTAYSIAGGGYGNFYGKCWVDGNGSGNAYLSGVPSTFISGAVMYSMIDCLLDAKNSGEHSGRVQGMDKFAIVSNEFRDPGESKSLLTVRGWQLTDLNTVMHSGNVSHNFFNGENGTKSSPWPTQLAPQNNGVRENIKDIVWSGNRYRLNATSQLGLYVTARDVSARGNLLYTPTTGGFLPFYTVYTNTNSTLTPLNVDYDYNTVVAPFVDSFSLFNSDANTSTSRLRGNLVYAPLATKDYGGNGPSPSVVYAGSLGTGNVTGTNSTVAQFAIDPLLVGPTTTRAGYALQSGSYAKNLGTDVAFPADALGYLRTGLPYDLGACNAPDKQVDAWTLIP